MNTAAKVVLGIGIVMIIIGIILFATTGDDFEDNVVICSSSLVA